MNAIKKINGTWLIGLALLYGLALYWLDSYLDLSAVTIAPAWAVATALILSIANLLIRYMRWRTILLEQRSTTPWLFGLLAYLAGFAYTATPGKAGELSRALYYRKVGISPQKVFSAFVIERFFDLLAVSALASLIFFSRPEFSLVGIATLALIAFVLAATRIRRFFLVLAQSTSLLAPKRWHARIFRFLAMVRVRVSLGVASRKMPYYFTSGLIAWLCLSLAFAVLCYSVNIQANGLFLASIYPAAMLAGAITFIPGGVGSTEVAIVALLLSCGTPLALGLGLAILIRLLTLWLATCIGFISIIALK